MHVRRILNRHGHPWYYLGYHPAWFENRPWYRVLPLAVKFLAAEATYFEPILPQW